MNITPMGARFIGRIITGDPELGGGIIAIPDTARQDLVRVDVLAVGEGSRSDKTGRLTPTGLKPGDVAMMLFGHWIVGAEIGDHYGEDSGSVRMLEASGVYLTTWERPSH